MNRIVGGLAAVLVVAGALGCGGSGGGPAASPQEPAPPAQDPEPPSGDPDPPPLGGLALSFTPVASGLAAPTVIGHAGDGSDRLFVAEQPGRVRILTDGALLPTSFLDISGRLVSGGERGLLGLAFPPGFAEKRYFYVNCTRAGDGATVLGRFHVSPADPNAALPDSEEVLLTVEQPFANHNGGQLAFGPDGFLYVALGDGGSGGDPQGNGQNLETLLGTLLRIDVEAGEAPYRIPDDNPFVSDPEARPEIWASGLRNPWRFSFDRVTGDLYLGDVGQGSWEEVNFQPVGAPGGADYGWNILEGDACFLPAVGCEPPPRYSPPIHVYGHGPECSVSGGYVYRGPGNPEMQGRYFYGDYCSGRVWGLRRAGNAWENALVAETGFRISTFGEDEAGRLYVADHGGGAVYRIDAP